MFKKTLIVVAVLIVALAISAFSWMAITRTDVSLTSYDAADAAAYRWEAIARFYEAQKERQSMMYADDLTVTSAYNWNALVNAKFDEVQKDLPMVPVQPGQVGR